ncbi:MAG TPA: anhydro-N-acetylmuramic acid kinase [Verrucomicrobiota bacterium]|nr:anhydro-N-acetylmuramic acid kinase [Verrucomicrobiota bacterium]HNU51567.1 anhydro-N-acetylmuramic acid kinase [Verrucomicrobiota bacterium]
MSPSPHARVLGIMSGTSIDSVDYALCRVTAASVTLDRHWQTAFPKALRQRLHRAARGQATSWELGQLHHDLGRFYAQAAAEGLDHDQPDLAGLHGQTVYHQPGPRHPATLQIGEPAWLAETLRIPVVSNFRVADLAAGGQGAPLATLFHQVAFGHDGQFVCVNNLGGISNVTAINRRRPHHPRVLAFDTGPANVLMDLAMRELTRGRSPCDHNGAWAAAGHPNPRLVTRWLRHPFFQKPPPKSTGRELFGEPLWLRIAPEIASARLSPCDLLATLAELTAGSIALNYRLHFGRRPDRVILAGGGADNPHLVRRIAHHLHLWAPKAAVLTSTQAGWPTQAIEAAAFALLAYCRLHGRPGNLPATTGARHPALLGQVSEPPPR